MDEPKPPPADDAALARQVDAAAAAIDLPIRAEHRAGVLRYYGIAAAFAAQVMAAKLTRDDEPAEVFVPVVPPVAPGAMPGVASGVVPGPGAP